MAEENFYLLAVGERREKRGRSLSGSFGGMPPVTDLTTQPCLLNGP